MNTCSRIETTGQKNKIHMSLETTELLIAAGKSHWVVERKDKVQAKGKGNLDTFWLEIRRSSDESTSDPSNTDWDEAEEAICKSLNTQLDEKAKRLIDWNTELLCQMLRAVVARRQAVDQTPASQRGSVALDYMDAQNPIDEVKEIVNLPQFNSEAAKKEVDPASITLDPNVEKELKDYVTTSMSSL